MRVFACPHCGAWVEFEDLRCLACLTLLAFDPDRDAHVRAVDVFTCRYRSEIDCNWVTDPDPSANAMCGSCRLTTVRPGRHDAVATSQLVIAESAKRRLLRQLAHLHLPVAPRRDGAGLAFELKAPMPGEPVTTGHADGVISVDLTESNDAHREALRIELDESYRTMLGHFRHEIGHYYWQVLVDGGPELEPFRDLFGDERQDYGDALDAHYGDGADDDWADAHISHYATTHPWEDFAETFAHYLHITDALETAWAVGITIDGPVSVPPPLGDSLHATGAADVADDEMSAVLAKWHVYRLGLTAVSRSMGRSDFYPFVITPPIAEKLAFVHGIVRAAR